MFKKFFNYKKKIIFTEIHIKGNNIKYFCADKPNIAQIDETIKPNDKIQRIIIFKLKKFIYFF